MIATMTLLPNTACILQGRGELSNGLQFDGQLGGVNHLLDITILCSVNSLFMFTISPPPNWHPVKCAGLVIHIWRD